MGTNNFFVLVEELLILKIEATGFSDSLVPVYQIPRRHWPNKHFCSIILSDLDDRPL